MVSTPTAEGPLEGLNRKSFALTQGVQTSKQTIKRSSLVGGCPFGLNYSAIRLFRRALKTALSLCRRILNKKGPHRRTESLFLQWTKEATMFQIYSFFHTKKSRLSQRSCSFRNGSLSTISQCNGKKQSYNKARGRPGIFTCIF